MKFIAPKCTTTERMTITPDVGELLFDETLQKFFQGDGTTVGGIPIQADGDKTYRHVQGTASASWVVAHNLNKYPAVSVVDSTGIQVEGTVDYFDLNNVTITFSSAFAGEAFFN